MKTQIWRFSVVVALALGCVGCGATALDVCIGSCDANKRCKYASDTDVANCKTDCNNNKGKCKEIF